MTEPFMTFFTANGGRANEGRMLINGMPVAASFNGGGVSTFIYDVANTDEMQVLVSGGLGEAEAGGPSVNLIPRSGGNTFNGTAFYSGTGNGLRSDNIDDVAAQHRPDTASGTAQPVRRQRRARRPASCATGCGSSAARATSGARRSSRALFANRNAGDATHLGLRAGHVGRRAQRESAGHLPIQADRAAERAEPRLLLSRISAPLLGVGDLGRRRRLPGTRVGLDRSRARSPRRPSRGPGITISRTTSRRRPGRRRCRTGCCSRPASRASSICGRASAWRRPTR